MKELEFIQYLQRRFRPRRPVVIGIGDDCAVLEYTRDKYLLLATDMIIEGVHFSKKARPFQIGWKAIAVNISDIAAMGGEPKYALVSVGIPRAKNMRFRKDLTGGIKKICDKFGISVIGGDTNSSAKTVVSVTLLGEVRKGRLATRSGAGEGDLIFVTGALGERKAKHMHFTPRIKESQILVKNFKINSMIDLSDGLSMDLNRLAKSSNTGACVYKSLVPLSEKSEPLNKAVFAGEDFELLFTASLAESKKIIKRMGEKEDLPVTLIGEVMPKRFGIKLVEEDGRVVRLKPKGFRHL